MSRQIFKYFFVIIRIVLTKCKKENKYRFSEFYITSDKSIFEKKIHKVMVSFCLNKVVSSEQTFNSIK